MKPLAIDLFCGAGGMSEGILQAGFHIVYSSDISEEVEETYTYRHQQLGLIHGVNTFFQRADIRDLNKGNLMIMEQISALEMFQNRNRPKIDVIFGGPPCQGYSRAGLRDKNDPRNQLFREYLRIVEAIKPSYVVMENVEGFLDFELENFEGVNGNVYVGERLVSEILTEELQMIHYRALQPRVLDASDYGVPQSRRRVIFIAYRTDEPLVEPQYPLPTTPERKVTVRQAISDLITDVAIRERYNPAPSSYQRESRIGRTFHINGGRIRYNRQILRNHDLSNHYDFVRERFSLFKNGESDSAVMNRLQTEGIDLSGSPNLLRECLSKLEDITEYELRHNFLNGTATQEMLDALLTKKNSRTRLDMNGVSPTMLTLPDDFISPFENRILSVREMARLQSFDDSFEFRGKRTTGGERRKEEVPQYTQVGNAVPPLLAKAVAWEIRRAIEQSKSRQISNLIRSLENRILVPQKEE